MNFLLNFSFVMLCNRFASGKDWADENNVRVSEGHLDDVVLRLASGSILI